MSAIRPDLPPLPQAVTPAPMRAAQAAFFRAALDQATAAPAQAAPSGTGQATETPRAQRPGALLDIRV